MAAGGIISVKTILIVDDEPQIAEIAGDYLRVAGFDVITTGDGVRALEMVRGRHPDLVVLDLGLPGMDGYEVARQIRRQCKDAITIVALTGYGEDHARRQTAAAGFDAHLVKPVEPDELRRLLADRGAIGGGST